MNGFMIGGSRVRLSWGRSQAAAKGDYRPYQSSYPVHQSAPTSQYPIANVQPHPQASWMGYTSAPVPMVNVQPLAVRQTRSQIVSTPHVSQPQYQVQPLVYNLSSAPQLPLQAPAASPLAPIPVAIQNSEYMAKKAELVEKMDLIPSRNTLSIGASTD